MDSGASKMEAPVVGRTRAGGEPGVLCSLVGQVGRQKRAQGDSENASGRQGRGAVPLPRRLRSPRLGTSSQDSGVCLGLRFKEAKMASAMQDPWPRPVWGRGGWWRCGGWCWIRGRCVVGGGRCWWRWTRPAG